MPSKWEERGRKVEEFGKKVEQAGDKIIKLGCALTLLITVPIIIIVLLIF